MGRYWLVLCYYNPGRAGEAFESLGGAGLPTLLFESILYEGVRCVAAYGSDEEFAGVEYPVSDDSYAGLPRVFELFMTALLIDVANLSTRSEAEAVEMVASMVDEP